jgi:hypothetical protein
VTGTHLLYRCPSCASTTPESSSGLARLATPFITCYQALSSPKGLSRFASRRDSIQPQKTCCQNCNSWNILQDQFKSEGLPLNTEALSHTQSHFPHLLLLPIEPKHLDQQQYFQYFFKERFLSIFRLYNIKTIFNINQVFLKNNFTFFKKDWSRSSSLLFCFLTCKFEVNFSGNNSSYKS